MRMLKEPYLDQGEIKYFLTQDMDPLELIPPLYRLFPDKFKVTSYALSSPPVGKRREFVRGQAGFTTQDENHLLGFGEYAAMYLLVWSPDVWPRNKKFDDEVENMRHTLSRIRRLLANIVTYMIFDDHDVTDDWFLDERWFENSKESVVGRRIVANALAAYWAFQAWGNDPPKFGRSFRKSISEYLQACMRSNGTSSDGLADKFESTLWEFHDWAFAAPTSPLTVFLDTRTLRRYDIVPRYQDQKFEAPRLLNREGLLQMLSMAVNAGYSQGDPLMIVSATPVYGYGPAEWVQENLLVPGVEIIRGLDFPVGRYAWDLESWHANRLGFFEFITFVSEMLQPSYCVFLSGDVHFAWTATINYTQFRQHWPSLAGLRRPKMPIKTRFVQLTSSSLKNATSATRNLVAKHLTRHFTFPEVKGLENRLLRSWPSPSDKKPGIFLDAERWEPTIGAGSSPVIGETNLGYVTVHTYGRGYPGVTHTILMFDAAKYQDKNGLASNTATVATYF
jgi:hypothetical protein